MKALAWSAASLASFPATAFGLAHAYYASDGRLTGDAPLEIAAALAGLSAVQLLARGRGVRYQPAHNAHYATRDELAAMMLSARQAGNSILLGSAYRRLIAARPGIGGRREVGHSLFVAPARAGKGLHLMTQLLTWRGSAIVVDIKGELYDKTAAYRARMGQRLLVLDPSGRGQRYDPFAELGTDEGLKAAANTIIEPDKDGSNRAFGQRASSALYAMMRYALLEGKPVLPCVRHLTGDGIRYMSETLVACGDAGVIQGLKDFLGKPPADMHWDKLEQNKFLENSWSGLIAKLQNFFSPGVLAMTSRSDFRARDLVAAPTTLYLIFSESDLEFTGAAFSTVLLALIDALLREYDRQHHGERERVRADLAQPLLCCFDEAGRIRVPRLEDLVSTVAGRGISVLTYVQSLSQLESSYTRSGAETIRDNSHSQIFYAPKDLNTARYVSERAGQFVINDYRHSTHSVAGGLGESYGLKPRDLITPDEVMRLPPEQCLVFAYDRQVIRAHRLEPWFLKGGSAAMALPQPPIRTYLETYLPVRFGPPTQPASRDGPSPVDPPATPAPSPPEPQPTESTPVMPPTDQDEISYP